jgi:acyl-CoA hydrolase
MPLWSVQATLTGAREKVRVTPGMTLAHMTQLIMPQHANSLGITFGGQVILPASSTPLS